MKYNILYAAFFFLFVLSGCFKDEGKYDYLRLDAPEWKDFDPITVRAGETAKFNSASFFTWKADSAQRASEVRYEWKIGEVLLSEEASFEAPADEIIRKIGLTKFDGEEKFGTFAIIDKKTEITYMQTVIYKFIPTNASGDWFVISEKNGNTKLSFIRRNKNEQGVITYELKEDVYPTLNGEEMQGKPLFMSYADGATNIGAMGTITVLTSQKAYEINCENFMKVGNLEEVPVNGPVILRTDAYSKGGDDGLQTFVTDENGNVYRRMMTSNNLGGAFTPEPMFLDTKGLQISKFGQTLKGFNNVPCYDELNGRIVILLFYTSGKMDDNPWFPQPDGKQYQLSKFISTEPALGVSVAGCAKVWDMPAGTQPIHLWYIGAGGPPFAPYDKYGMVYNDAVGKTWLTEFAVNQKSGAAMNDGGNKNIEFPGGDLEKDACILASSCMFEFYYNKINFILYSKGNEVRYLSRGQNLKDNAYIRLEDPNDRVTFMAWSSAFSYANLVVCTQNGKVIFYDASISNNSSTSNPLIENPKVVAEFDLGGRVVSAKELDNMVSYSTDKY